MSSIKNQTTTSKAEQVPLLDVGGDQMLLGLRSALTWLKANENQINDLNVFPVPDGDTGSNMYLTMRAAVEEAEKAPDPNSSASVWASASHGSLMGARGNSGVILSQIFRGFSQGLRNQSRVDAKVIAGALVEASKVAYKAVIKPKDGTLLTVVRDASEIALVAAQGSSDIRLVLQQVVVETHAAVARTTEQLPVLREAGVVDAAGFGFAVVLEGFSQAIAQAQIRDQQLDSDENPTILEPQVLVPQKDFTDGSPTAMNAVAAISPSKNGFGFCTEFLINGPGLDIEGVRGKLIPLGESAVVVGDDQLVRVHIHTFEPDTLIGVASQCGRLSKLKVDDMSAQHHEIREKNEQQIAKTTAPKSLAVVAIVSGEGFSKILLSLGAGQVIDAQSADVLSVERLLKAVELANAKTVILLPNREDVIKIAEQVDALAKNCSVIVIPTRNMPQGVSALFECDFEVDVKENQQRMLVALANVEVVEITSGTNKADEIVAIKDNAVIASSDNDLALIKLVIDDLSKEPELITLYYGAEITQNIAKNLVEGLKTTYPALAFELQAGGQEHCHYVLSFD